MERKQKSIEYLKKEKFSIIICTYNPNEDIFKRLFKALESIESVGLIYEVIIVDNNSSTPINSIVFIQDFLIRNKFVKLFVERTPGLTAARTRGINEAKYDWLVFFDDDNEPDSDYLIRICELLNEYPKVAVWGPGRVDVEYTGMASSWLNQKKNLFQQRNERDIQYDFLPLWQPCYPFGTGLVMKNEISREYLKRVHSGKYTISDRKGKSLSSGGDVQMVLTGVQMGFGAGVSPTLKIAHLISKDKTKFSYLCRLAYGTASAYTTAHNEVFGRDLIKYRHYNNRRIIKYAWKFFLRSLKLMDLRSAFLEFISRMGSVNSFYVYYDDSKPPSLLKFIELIFRL